MMTTNCLVPVIEGQDVAKYLEKPSPEDESMYRRQAAGYLQMVARLIESGVIDGAKVEWQKGWKNIDSSLMVRRSVEFIEVKIEV